MELLTLLRTIAPEFEELEDTTLQTWLDLTQPLVSKSAFDAAYEQAVAYLAAHRMKMAGLGESGPRMRFCAPREAAVFNIRP